MPIERKGGGHLVHQPEERGIKATRASVHAGTCGCVDGQMDRIWMWYSDVLEGGGMDVGVGSSDEEHSLMDSPGVMCGVLGRWECGLV